MKTNDGELWEYRKWINGYSDINNRMRNIKVHVDSEGMLGNVSAFGWVTVVLNTVVLVLEGLILWDVWPVGKICTGTLNATEIRIGHAFSPSWSVVLFCLLLLTIVLGIVIGTLVFFKLKSSYSLRTMKLEWEQKRFFCEKLSDAEKDIRETIMKTKEVSHECPLLKAPRIKFVLVRKNDFDA